MAITENVKALAAIEGIENSIHVIRGQRVMLDSDLAKIYQVETRTLNQALKRNLKRFPIDFVFQLDVGEAGHIRSQSVIASKGTPSQTVSASKRNIRYLPYAFTEHGAVMLASVLNSPTAVEASIAVVRAFVRLRQVLNLHHDLAARLDQLEKTVGKHDEKFTVVSHLLRQILGDPKTDEEGNRFHRSLEKGKEVRRQYVSNSTLPRNGSSQGPYEGDLGSR